MYGKLGHGNEFGNSSPRRVDGLVGTPVVMVACGSRHTACIGGNGSCYAWGDRENGVAGHTSGTGAHQRTPKLLERLAGRRVTGLSACGFHTGNNNLCPIPRDRKLLLFYYVCSLDHHFIVFSVLPFSFIKNLNCVFNYENKWSLVAFKNDI